MSQPNDGTKCVEYWNASRDRYSAISEITKIQSILTRSQFALLKENDIEHDMASNHFLLREDMVAHYLLFRGCLYFLNPLHSNGAYTVCNWFPTYFVPFDVIVDKGFARKHFCPERLYYLEMFNSDLDAFCFHKEFSWSDFLFQQLVAFQKTFHVQDNIHNLVDIGNDLKLTQSSTTTIFPLVEKKEIGHNGRLVLHRQSQKKTYRNVQRLFVHPKYVSTTTTFSLSSPSLLPTQSTQETKGVEKEMDLCDPLVDHNSIHTAESQDGKVILITVGWNEQNILPMFLEYYGPQVDKIVYYDNQSTDDSLSILSNYQKEMKKGCATLQVIEFDTSNQIRDDMLIELKNTAWKNYTDPDFRWLIIVDVDEFIVPLMRKPLREFLNENKIYDAVQCVGYQMFGPKYSLCEIRKGARCDQYDKVCCWNLETLSDINYSPGCHKCCPVFNKVDENRDSLLGCDILSAEKDRSETMHSLQTDTERSNIKRARHTPSTLRNNFRHSDINPVVARKSAHDNSGSILQRACQLRHMKYVGSYMQLCQRASAYQDRLSDVNKQKKWGSQYSIVNFKKSYSIFSKRCVDLGF